MPNSRFALHGRCPSLIHGLCAFFASNSRFVRLFQAALDTPLDSPFSATLSVHGLHFTVFRERQVVVFVADDLRFSGPGIPDLVTELCPPRDTA